MGKVNRVSNMIITKMGQYSISFIESCEDHNKQEKIREKQKKEVERLEKKVERAKEQLDRVKKNNAPAEKIEKAMRILYKAKARLNIKKENYIDENLKKYNIDKDFTDGKSYREIFNENVYTGSFNPKNEKAYQQKFYEEYNKIGVQKKAKSDTRSKSTTCVESLMISTPLTIHPDDVEAFQNGTLEGSKEAKTLMKDIEKEILNDERFKDCIFLRLIWHFDEIYMPMFEKVGVDGKGKDIYRELTLEEAMKKRQIKIHLHFDFIPIIREKVNIKIPILDEMGNQMKDEKGHLLYVKKLDEDGNPIKNGKRFEYETIEIERKSLNRTKIWDRRDENYLSGEYKEMYKFYREGLIDRVNERHKENNLVYSIIDEELDDILKTMSDKDLNSYILDQEVNKIKSAEAYKRRLNEEIEVLIKSKETQTENLENILNTVDIYQVEAERLRNNNLLEEKNLEEARNKKKIVDKKLDEVEELAKKKQYQVEELTNEIDTLNIMSEQKENLIKEKDKLIKEFNEKLNERIQKEAEENIHNEAMKNLYRLDKNGDFLVIDNKYIFTEETSIKIKEIEDEFFAELSDLPIEKIKEISENREVLKYLKEYFPNLKQDILEKGKEKEYGITKNIDDILK